jgi:uncharacterized iron-regulated membrane protein
MNKKLLKRLTKQHTVLGTVSSCFLILVFVCGSLLFFRGQLLNWQFAWQQPNVSERVTSWQSAISAIDTLKPEWLNQRLTVTSDWHTQRVLQFYVGHDLYLFDNQTQQIFGEITEEGAISDYLYFLHIDLTAGFVGRNILLIACWLLIMVCISGVYIRWRDLVTKFYQYRIDGKSRDVFKDIHVLLGLGGLIFCFIYGVTSAYFNGAYYINSPIYQKFAEKSDNDYWLEAGFIDLERIEKSNKQLNEKTVNNAISHFTNLYPEHRISRFDIYTKPVTRMRIKGESDNAFNFITAFYNVHGQLIDYSKDSAAVDAYTLMVQLHDGHILGKPSHLIYFILTLMAIASMYLGNIYWVVMRAIKQKDRLLFRVQCAVLEACGSGALVTIAVLLFATKVLDGTTPLSKWDYQLITIFGLLFSGLITFFYKDIKVTNKWLLYTAGGMFLSLPVFDLIKLMLGDKLYSTVVYDLLSIHFVFTILGFFCISLAKLMTKIEHKVARRSAQSEVY